jgi:hypothetical protein
VALKLIYLMFTKLLGWVLLHIRSDTTKDIEILLLRINPSTCGCREPCHASDQRFPTNGAAAAPDPAGMMW